MPQKRMPATIRQRQILDAATHCFANRGFGGTTTAQIANKANLNEALIFRYFGSKQDLYISCVDAAWQQILERVEELTIDQEHKNHWRLPGRSFLELMHDNPHVAKMWVRGMIETTGNKKIDEHLTSLMRMIHSFISDMINRSSKAGSIIDGRDAKVEAWHVIALGLLGSAFVTRNIISPDEFNSVLMTHREWMTGITK